MRAEMLWLSDGGAGQGVLVGGLQGRRPTLLCCLTCHGLRARFRFRLGAVGETIYPFGVGGAVDSGTFLALLPCLASSACGLARGVSG